jgi:hypothetical protein
VYGDGKSDPPPKPIRASAGRSNQGLRVPEAQFTMGEHFYKGETGPPDYVSAYVWYALTKRNGGKDGERMLKVLAAEMTAEQLGEAETRVDYWPEDPPKEPQ